MNIANRGISVVAFMLLTACATKTPTPPTPAEAYSSMDEFVNALAVRVKNKFDPKATVRDFDIIPSQASWPIGTLLRPGTTYPVNETACLVKPSEKVDVPNLFPSFSRINTVAFDIGLDNAVINRLAELKVKVSNKEDINFNVDTPQIQMMDDSTADNLMNNKGCKAVLSGKTMWLIRGYIIGKRTFSFTRGGDGDSSVHGKIEQVGSFTIDLGSGSSSVKVTDTIPRAFLQIVSEVNLQPSKPRFAMLSIPAGIGKVHVQRDKQDTTDTGERLVEAIFAADIPVAQRIDNIDSFGAPLIAQVLYFNDADKAASEKVLWELKKKFPDARASRVAIPAAKGQLEVVLPRAK